MHLLLRQTYIIDSADNSNSVYYYYCDAASQFDIYLPLGDCPFNTEAGKTTALAIPWYPLLCCAIMRDFDSGSSSSVDTVITSEKKKKPEINYSKTVSVV